RLRGGAGGRPASRFGCLRRGGEAVPVPASTLAGRAGFGGFLGQLREPFGFSRQNVGVGPTRTGIVVGPSCCGGPAQMRARVRAVRRLSARRSSSLRPPQTPAS